MKLNIQISLFPLQIRAWREQQIRLLIVRHGQTVANVDPTQNKIFTDRNIPLTNLGEQQAAEAGRFIADFYAQHGVRNQARMWCSTYKRAQDTGDIILQSIRDQLPKIEIDQRYSFNLREQEFGLEDGMNDDELKETFPNVWKRYQRHTDQQSRFYARKYNGESWADVAQRTQNWIGTMQRDAEKHGIYDVIVVAHGVTNRALTMAYCHHDHFNPNWFETERNPKNCSVRLIDSSGPDGDKRYIFTPQNQ